MSTSTIGLFVRHLAVSEEAKRLKENCDRDLLAAYQSHRSEAAFTELMRRYEALVLRTCRRVLGQGPDAEDAFQATFILLARKAGQLGREAAGALSLGGWLHRVAYQTSLDARIGMSRRKAREQQANVMAMRPPSGSDPAVQATWNEVQPILDAEMDALPEQARRLLIACYLQEKTYTEVAAELGLPRGSIAWHVEKARTLLAARLARRGITVSGLLLAILLEVSAKGAGVPATLRVHTVEAARRFTEQEAGVLSENVARLVTGGLAQMARGWTHWSMALVGWVGLLGAGLLACQTLKAWPDPMPQSEPPAAAERPAPEEDKPARTDRYGDPLPLGALARLGTTRLRHNGGVHSLVFTPDGKGVLTAGGDNLPRLWDADTGKLLREFRNIPKPQLSGDQTFGVSAAILSPDGRLLAVRSGRMGNLYLLETATGKRLHEFPCETGDGSLFLNFAFSPDSKAIAAKLDGRLELREVATGQTLWQKDAKDITALAFSPDGKTLASWVAREGVHLCDARTGKPLRELRLKCKLAHLAFSPDGRTLTVGTVGYAEEQERERCNSVHLWDMATSQQTRQLSEYPSKMDEGYYYPVFSPDGKIVAARGGKGICLWEAATGKELRRWPDGSFHWSAAAFSPDGKVLAALDGLLVRFWDVTSGKALPSRLPAGHESAVSSLAFTPDGQTLISAAGDHTVRWWNTTTSQQRLCLPVTKDPLRFQGPPIDDSFRRACVSALSPDGTMLAVTSIETPAEELPARNGLLVGIRLLDAATGKELRRLDSGNSLATGLTFSPDGKVLAEVSGRPSSRVRLWDVASGKRERELAGRWGGSCPQFSPDGRLLVTYNDFPMNTVIHFWEAATGKEVNALRTNERIHCLALSPDGNMLATGSDRITLYPLSRVKPSSIQVGSSRLIASSLGFVTALDFSSDGRLLASSGTDHAIHLWETASGKERARLHGHGRTSAPWKRGVTSLCFTADGRRLASGSGDSTILIWDVTGRLQDGQLRAAQLSAKELEGLWADLRGDDAARAGRALWTLAAAPAQAVPYLAERLRTSVADSHKVLARVPQLLRDLDDDAFPVREQAKAELTRLGAAAEPALRQALAESPSLEMRRSLEQLLKAAEAERQTPSGEALHTVRALEVLEQIGTHAAREALKTLMAGTPAASSLTHEAQAALERLDRAQRR